MTAASAFAAAARIAEEFDWADEPITPGYLFLGGDGWEWSERHPIQSGEQPDATEVRRCNWRQWARDNVGSAIAFKIRSHALAQSGSASAPSDIGKQGS